ncbi:hypothetical protein LAZ67_7001542 [Cordylochernes scorpioides]|uniref:Tc1-like transposase DDE domain-containing protein n=1 Tax=Cordylochernes scorpioides TaxID=51811 RepID=A0ABY6KQL7_9ARAC|nr:hypothetical protein LAZ67_7001542 [Cordylochernes scorpioides]
MPCRKQRSSFDQVYEFDRGKIVAYRDWRLSFRKIGSRVGRNQTTVMRICDRLMQEGMTDVFDRIHHSAPLHVLTSKFCVMHRHTGPAPGIMVWGSIGYLSRTPLVRIAGTLNSQRYISEVLEPVVLPYLQGLPTAIFQQDNARPHVVRIVQRFFVNRQIELLPWPAHSPDLLPIENMWSMVAQQLTQITSCHIRSTLITCGSSLLCYTPITHPNTSLHLGRPLKILTKYRHSWSRQSGKLGNVHTKNEDTVALRKFCEQIKVELGAKDGDRIDLTGLHGDSRSGRPLTSTTVHTIAQFDRLATPDGTILVTVQGDKLRPAIITVHDLGMNASSTFRRFIHLYDVKRLMEKFCLYHITVPGHELGATAITPRCLKEEDFQRCLDIWKKMEKVYRDCDSDYSGNLKIKFYYISTITRLLSIEQGVEKLNRRIHQLENTMENTVKSVSKNSERIQQIEKRIEFTEIKMRESNLIFYGVEKKENETSEESLAKIK